MSIIFLALVLLNSLGVENYVEYFENDNGDIITNEKHTYTTVEDRNGDILFTIDYDESSKDINVIY